MAELFPGQVERIDLTIEQVRVLSSEIRNEVFYSYQKREPRSVAEVANGLGKSAQTVHYHTNELADAGLLIAVEERKVRSRTEKLYVHAALSTNSRPAATVDDAYRAEIVAGFNAVAKSLAREMEAAHEVIGHDKDFGKLVGYQQNRIRVSLENAYEIKRLLYELRDSLDRFHDPEGEFRIRTSVFMAPSLETSREAMKKAKKHKA